MNISEQIGQGSTKPVTRLVDAFNKVMFMYVEGGLWGAMVPIVWICEKKNEIQKTVAKSSQTGKMPTYL